MQLIYDFFRFEIYLDNAEGKRFHKKIILSKVFFLIFVLMPYRIHAIFNLIYRSTQKFNTSHPFTQTIYSIEKSQPKRSLPTYNTTTITMKPTTKSRSLLLRVYCITRAYT